MSNSENLSSAVVGTEKPVNYVAILRSQHVKIDDDDIVIQERKRELNKKTPLYMWNLTKKCYVSSLKPTVQPNVFTFDIRGKGENIQNYTLIYDNCSLKIEIKKD